MLAAPGLARRRPSAWRLDRTLALAGLFFAGDLLCWNESLALGSVANATVIANLSPVVVTLGAWLLWRERASAGFLAGMAAAISGATLMALAHSGHGALAVDPALGDGLAVATALWYGAYFLTVRQARERHGAVTVMIGSSLAGAPPLALAALILRERLVPGAAGGWAALVGLGFTQAAGQGAIAWALGRLPAPTAAVVVLIQPVAAAALAFAVLGEGVSPLQTLGGAVALAGVAFAVVSEGKGG